MNEIITWVTTQLTTNEFFAGGLVMGLIGWLAVVAREWPQHVFAFVARQLMTELTIRSTDGAAFIHAALWLAKHKDRKHARRLGMVDYWDSDDPDAENYEVTFGFGNHVLWRKWWQPVFLTRSVEEASHTSNPVQTLNIRMFGRRHDFLLNLIEEARVKSKESPKIGVYVWSNGHYRCADRRTPRPVESVIMPKADKEGVVNDLLTFGRNKTWYQDRGLPYRRGYLLEGPPGTGKSSFIMALAGVVKKDIYIINPATVSNDNELMEAFGYAGANVVVIEDIDAVDISNTREEASTDKKKEPQRLTLSGLLNAIDGVSARDGRILFITSNHPDKLDPALIRPGRVDRRVHLGLMTRELGAEMFERFYPGEDPTAFLDSQTWPQSPAQTQGALLSLEASNVIPLPTKEPKLGQNALNPPAANLQKGKP